MIPPEKDFKIIRKNFEKEKNLDRIRLGNQFVEDFLFEDQQIADIPINALRVIFNIISMISVLFIIYFGSKNILGNGWRVWDIATFTTFIACYTKLSTKSSKYATLSLVLVELVSIIS